MTGNCQKIQSRIERLVTSVPASVLLLITLFSAAGSFVAGYLVWPSLKLVAEPFHDITVGGIAFAGLNKSCDYQLVYITLATFLLLWLVLFFAMFIRQSGRPASDAPPQGFAWNPGEHGIVIAAALAYLAGLALVRSNAGYLELLFILIPLLFIYGLKTIFKGGANDDAVPPLGLLLAAPVIGFFSTIALVKTCHFFFSQHLEPYHQELAWLPFIGSGAAFLVLAVLYKRKHTAEKIVRYLQVPLPLLLLTGFCRIYLHNGMTSENMTPPSTKLFVLILAALGIVAAGYTARYKKGSLISILSVVMVAVYLGYDVPKFLAADFLHDGETLLSWHQIFQKGQTPFSGFAMARGFNDCIPGFFNEIFFDGNLASYSLGNSLHSMFGSGLFALILSLLLGTGWSSLIVLGAVAAPVFKTSFFIPILLLFLLPQLLKRPLYWVICWIAVSALHCLLQSTAGIFLTLGTLPIAIWFAWKALENREIQKEWQEHRVRLLSITVPIVLTALALFPVYWGWVSYILEQGGVNSIAHGTPLGLRTVVPAWFRFQSVAVWETYRIAGWILGCYLLWYLAVRGIALLSCADKTNRTALIVVTVAGICSSVAAVQYSMGRIDAKGISRPGSITLMLIGVIIPVAFILYGRCRSSAYPGILAALFVGLAAGPYYQPPPALAAKALEPIRVADGAIAVNGSVLGVPGLGNALIEPHVLQVISDFKAVADNFLLPGETYFDMTNHVAFYFLFDKKVPAHYAGYANITSKKAQERVIATLKRDMPPLVWIAPAREFEFGKASLRTYRIYQALLETGYTALLSGDTCFMVRNDRYTQVTGQPTPREGNAALLSDIFGSKNFDFLPASWGNNFVRLQGLFERQATLSLESAQFMSNKMFMPEQGTYNSVITITWPHFSQISGSWSDFITFTPKSGSQSGPIDINISWADSNGSFSDSQSVYLKANLGSPVLVPMGADPRWLLSTSISGIRISLVGAPSADLGISPPEMLHLIP